MELYPHLYIGKSVRKPNKLIRKLKKRSKFMQFYVICVSANPNDQLEIYKACYLSQKYYKTNTVYVIGLASDYDEAISIIETIVKECYEFNQTCELKKYLFREM